MKKYYICSNCGYKNSKWLGKCPECGTWNSFIEEIETAHGHSAASARSDRPGIEPVPITDISLDDKQRTFSGFYEMDRVLGGMVPGQTIFLAGEPGIGKSTLILGVANILAATWMASSKKVIYINGEESNSQVKMRSVRTGANSPNLFLYGENDIENIKERVRKEKPGVLFVDSVQTVYSGGISSLPGSVVQMREATFELVTLCKELDVVLFLIGHITKAGVIAGPKIVEHMVDTVLFMEADTRGYYRILRCLKNRFYSTEEAGFFTMEADGLKGIEDLSKAFTYRHKEAVRGISVYPLMEGNRVIPVEIQALTVPSQFNYPKRSAEGMDSNRLSMLIAVMEKNLKISLSGADVYLNVTNGLRIGDPSLDLAAVMAIYSSFKDAVSPQDTAAFGEVGMTGEVRPAVKMEKRIAEMARLGFRKIVVPYNEKALSAPGDTVLLPISNIVEGVQALF